MKIVIKKWLVMMDKIIYLNQIKIIFVLGKKYNEKRCKLHGSKYEIKSYTS